MASLSIGLASAIEAAAKDARQRSHIRLSLEHLLVAMLTDDDVRDVLTRCSIDVVDLERELRDYLDLLEPQRGGLVGFDEYADRATRRAALRSTNEHDDVTLRDVLARIPSEPESYAAMLVHAAGVEPTDLLRVIAHDTMSTELAIPDGEWLAVRVHNDDFTPQAFVVHLLMDVFRMQPSAAQAAMMQIHGSDSAVVATLRRDDAIGRARDAVELVEEHDFPLRCTLEPAE
ncbi:MAG: ATP-dependent Clp protease adaptor ClpS [Polyangia bacterium]